MKKEYFHVCADGADARNFIIKEADYYAAFNHVAVCAANTDVVVVSFSGESKKNAPVIKSSMRLFISIMRLLPGKAVPSLCSVVNFIRLAMTLIICGMSPSIQSFNQRKTASP